MKNALERALRGALKSAGIEPPAEIEITVPREESFGDLSTTVALALAKALKRRPRAIAEDLLERIPDEGVFEKMEVAGPGYMNFTFRDGFLFSSLRAFLLEGLMLPAIGLGRRVLIEFVSANPTGPLHLGHGRGAALGNALANLLKAGGYDVVREYYINDAGRQVRLLGESVFAGYKELSGEAHPIPEDGYRGGYIMEAAKAFREEFGDKFKRSDFKEAEPAVVDFSLGMMLALIKKDLADFGVLFDSWRSEKELYESGDVKRAIEYLKGKGLMYESGGALWFAASRFGDEKDRVVLKSDGEYTYFASDIAYHKKKIDAGFEELINIWGADHHGYIGRLKAVLEALGYEREKLRVLLVQMVSLLRGGKPVQMSKRAGEFVTLREVIDDVGADTAKFIFLTRRPDSQLSFDLEEAKAASAENPVYYVQYASARIHSIFARAREAGAPAHALHEADMSLLGEKEELRILKKVLAYPMVFESALRSREPHRITFYLQELAGLFHPYYNRFRVITEDRGLTQARLALCGAVRAVLGDGLGILGVAAPERM